MTTREYLQWYCRGASDARDRTPRRRAPRLPEEELCNVNPPPEAAAYWAGWDGHFADAMMRIGRIT